MLKIMSLYLREMVPLVQHKVGNVFRGANGRCYTVKVAPVHKCKVCCDTGLRIDPVYAFIGFTQMDSWCTACAGMVPGRVPPRPTQLEDVTLTPEWYKKNVWERMRAEGVRT